MLGCTYMRAVTVLLQSASMEEDASLGELHQGGGHGGPHPMPSLIEEIASCDELHVDASLGELHQDGGHGGPHPGNPRTT
jgi:hypothetical protein